LFKTEDTNQVSGAYEYDRVLNFNTLTGAFYQWRISDSPVKVHAIVYSDEISSSVETDFVVDDVGDQLVDLDGNPLVAFIQAGIEDSPFDKYLVSYPDGAGSYNFTFADKTNAGYVDWAKLDSTGVNYVSTFTTGPKIKGQGIRKFQNNWLRVFSRLRDVDQAYYLQGIWDYGLNGNTGRWSLKQINSNQLAVEDYGYTSNRFKIRGSGLASQFKITSVDTKPFELIGWSTIESSNATA
jgi:hypothetical protein